MAIQLLRTLVPGFVILCFVIFAYVNYQNTENVYSKIESLWITGAAQPLIETNPKCFLPFQGVNSTRLITDLQQDRCYLDRSNDSFDARDCGCLHAESPYSNKISYLISTNDTTNRSLELTESELANDVIFSFIHLNKAGGTTIKKEILERAAIRNKWDAAAFGSFSGWSGMGERQRIASKRSATYQDVDGQDEIHRLYKVEPLYIKCGEMLSRNKLGSHWSFQSVQKCRLRVVWGALALGLCDHFPGSPCVYFTVFRNPLDRAISNYNYVCIQGAENRKKWLPEWKENNYCPLTLEQFLDNGFLEPNKLIERVTRGCDQDCGMQIALQNIQHPCFRYMILEQMKDGLEKLRDKFGPALRPEVKRLLATHKHRNGSPYTERVMSQINNATVIEKVKRKLHTDIRFYEAAKELYEAQWAKPLTSCNDNY